MISRTARSPRCIILSPHLDDGVLSCGGLASALKPHIEVCIWTLFSTAPSRGPWSPAALWLHGCSGGLAGSRLAHARRAEDRASCATLGVKSRHFPWTEAAYRKTSEGRLLYSDRMEVDVAPEDESMVDAISAALQRNLAPADLLLVPLAVAKHVDHVITRRAADRLGHPNTMYYPEIPYSTIDPGAMDRRGYGLRRFHYDLCPGDVSQWVAAVRCYETQIRMLEDAAGPISELIGGMPGGTGVWIYSPVSAVPPIFSKIGCARANEGADGTEVFLNPRQHPASKPENITPPSGSAPGPIAVFAFRRLDLLKQSLASLEKCDGFDGARVHVFSDAGREHLPDEVIEVERVRWWLADWCGRHGATQHDAPTNLGLRRSIVAGITGILEKNDRVIVLEDDLILSPSFITFIDGALEAYKNRENIVQVSGYLLPHSRSLPPLGLLRAPSSWGWGTWKRAWDYYRDTPEQLLAEMSGSDRHAFDMDGTYGYTNALERNATGTLDTWAVRWYASVFLRRGLSVYPRRSLVRNIGFGDDGTNCGPGPMAGVFDKQRIAGRIAMPDWRSVGVEESSAHAEATREFYRWQQHQWTKPTFSERVRSSLGRLVKPGVEV